MTLQLKAILAAILFALGAATGWITNGWRYGAELSQTKQQHAQTLAEVTQRSTEVAKVNKASDLANAAIAASDTKYTKELNDSKNAISCVLVSMLALAGCASRPPEPVVQHAIAASRVQAPPAWAMLPSSSMQAFFKTMQDSALEPMSPGNESIETRIKKLQIITVSEIPQL